MDEIVNIFEQNLFRRKNIKDAVEKNNVHRREQI